MNIDQLDYHLPQDLIAQCPIPDRSASRLLHYRGAEGLIEHRRFLEIDTLLRPGDLLVFNDARVTPAKFTLIKQGTGGRVEGLFVEQRGRQRWTVMLRNLGPVKPELTLRFENAPDVIASVAEKRSDGLYEIEVQTDRSAHEILDHAGRMPLPPYIHREKSHDDRDAGDRERYQTVYARTPGSIAAPTAGLHFTPQVMLSLQKRGVLQTFVALHVGLGTFKPIEVADITQHEMHVERYALNDSACEAINQARRDRRRVIAVGTTSARVLESQPAGELSPVTSETAVFIHPPYRWKHVNALFTNFHQPRSTLIALIAAMVGLDEQRRIYASAIEQRYRFLSYGDSSFLEM